MIAPDARAATAFVPVWTDRRWLLCAALLWVGCGAVYFLTAPGRIDMIDGGIRYDVTASLLDRGRPVVTHPLYFGVEGADGERYSYYQLGTTVTSVPFVLFGGWLGSGSLEAKQFAFSLTTVPFAAAAVALLFLIYGRLGCSMTRALTCSLVVAFCTMLWPYAGSTFDVALQAFWLTLAVWSTIEATLQRSYRWAAIAAVSFAMVINIQEMYVVLGASIVAAAPLTYRTVSARMKSPVILVVGLGVVVGVLLVLGYNTARFGNPVYTGRTSAPHPFVGNPIVGLAGLALSPAKSVFLYSPPFVLALIGLRRLYRMAPDTFAPLIACLVIQVGLVSSLRFWAGEWAWGPRYLVASLPLVCIGLPFGWVPKPGRTARWMLCAAGLVVQLLAISVDHQRYYTERGLLAYFWMDNATMYRDSPLLARPRELLAVVGGRDRGEARALVPGPLPLSMTSPIFGQPLDLVPYSREWMRRYLVFLAPRPWTLWSRLIPEHQRPGPTGAMTVVGGVAAIVGFVGLALAVIGGRRATD